MPFLRRFLMLVAAVALLVGLTTDSSAQEAPLDGQSFVVQVVDSEGTPTPHHLHFAGGQFESPECSEWGFDAGPYEATSDGDAIVFTATVSSEAEGVMTWTGRLEAGQLSGSVDWIKEGQDTIVYTFVGTSDGPS